MPPPPVLPLLLPPLPGEEDETALADEGDMSSAILDIGEADVDELGVVACDEMLFAFVLWLLFIRWAIVSAPVDCCTLVVVCASLEPPLVGFFLDDEAAAFFDGDPPFLFGTGLEFDLFRDPILPF